jgi:DNA polymerase III subunit gamma/tau
MAYLVLARKYRPQTFSEVVGQEHVTKTLANAFAQNRVHHAFLFCGPRGVGKTTAARVLGKALNCERGPTAEPCGTCAPCRAVTDGSAVDYYEMDGASNRGIDAIRELRDAVRYQPALLRKKVYVIDEVHMLTTEAFNALLKTLEEPPAHVTFVLATTEPHKLPNTILSRCQRYDFKLVSSARLIGHLAQIFTTETIEHDPAALALIARESGGSVRDSLSLADQVISFAGAAPITESLVADVLGVADRALTRSLVLALAQGDAKVALETVDAAIGRGVDEVQLARALVRYLRDLAVLQAAPGAEHLVEGSAEERAQLAAQAKEIPAARATQMLERMIRACDDLGQTQLPRVVLELALIDVAGLEPLVPLGQLIERLQGLERRLGPGPVGGGGRAARRPAARPAPEATSAPDRSAGAANRTATDEPRPAVPAVTAAGSPPSARAGQDRGASNAARSLGTARAKAAALADAPELEEPAPGALADAPDLGDAGLAPAAPGVRAVPAPTLSDEPQPASATGVADGSADLVADSLADLVADGSADLLDRWEEVIADLETAGKLRFVGACQQARIISWTEDKLVITLEEGSLDASIVGDRDCAVAIREVLKKRYGRDIGFEVQTYGTSSPAAPHQRSLAEVSAQRLASQRDARERAVREHPITKLVLGTFGAEIKEIKIDGG